MSDNSTLPGCFSLFPRALPPNNCSICHYREACKKYVKKDVLKEILERLDQIEQKLRG